MRISRHSQVEWSQVELRDPHLSLGKVFLNLTLSGDEDKQV